MSASAEGSNAEIDSMIKEALSEILAYFKCSNSISLFLDLVRTGESLALDELASQNPNVNEAKKWVERSMSHALRGMTHRSRLISN